MFDHGIVDSSVNETATNLLNADYGQHWLIVYPDLSKGSFIYISPKDRLKKKMAIYLLPLIMKQQLR